MLWRHKSLALLLFAALAAASCGYRLGGQAPVVLPESMRTLAIAEVENPTMEAWLEAALRSSIRDELNRRGHVRWADTASAEAVMKVRVQRFTAQSSVKDEDDRTLKFAVELRLDARLLRNKDSSVIWESGNITSRQSYTGDDLSQARSEAIAMAVRELADRMGHAY